MAKNRPYDGKNARALLLLPLCGVKKKALFGDGAYPPWADTPRLVAGVVPAAKDRGADVSGPLRAR